MDFKQNKMFTSKTKRFSGKTMLAILFVLFVFVIGIAVGSTYSAFQSTSTSNGTLSFAVNGHQGQISISNCDVRYDTSTLTNTFTILPNANYSVPTSISTYILTTEPTASNWANAPTGWTLNNTITTYSAGTITVDDLAMISANAKAIYISGECTASTYTITYNANGGSGTMSASTPSYGSQFTLKTNSFTRTGYTFAGWALSTDGELKYGNQAVIANMGDITLYAVWIGNKYAINFDGQNADILGTTTAVASYGESLPSITIPTRTGYTFGGYYTAVNGGGTQYYNASGASLLSYSQTDNIVLYAKWTIKSYTITINVNDTTYGSVNATSFSVNHGTNIYANGTTLRLDTFTGTTKSTATPSTNTAQYTYAFTKWRGDELDIPSGNYITITGATTITAYFTRVINQYTITFKNYDNTILHSANWDYGSTPSYSGTPTRAATAQYNYTFSGWSPTLAIVTGDATYTAQYSQITRKYTITFKNYDNSTLQSSDWDYGSTPSYSSTPSKPWTAQYSYTFTGWSPIITMVTGNATYTAQYSQAVRSYTVTFQDICPEPFNAATSTVSYTVQYGTTLCYQNAGSNMNTWIPTYLKYNNTSGEALGQFFIREGEHLYLNNTKVHNYVFGGSYSFGVYSDMTFVVQYP